ncbi:MAG: FG-GAP-like repeat-containing protein, partial [Promethearchaeota archaeon]
MKKIIKVVIVVTIVAIVSMGISLGFIFINPPSGPMYTKLLLDNDFQEAGRIFGTDVDGDGDIDIVSASAGLGEIAWWENINLVFTKHLITDNFDGVFFINIGDIDKDGDPDILGPSPDLDEVAWWENNDTTFIKHSLALNYESAYSINSFDVDFDDDIDILSTGTDEITWWENDGYENFTEHEISIGYPEVSLQGHASIFAADLDNDDDVDIVTGSTTVSPIGELCCWENNGTENFTKRELSNNYGRIHDLQPIDIDSDG